MNRLSNRLTSAGILLASLVALGATGPAASPARGESRGRIVAAAALDAYSRAVLASSPAAYYRLDDTGATAFDSSANRLSGTVGTSVRESVAGIIPSSHASAMQFPGDARGPGSVSVPATAKLTPSKALSMEAVLRFTRSPTQYTALLSYGSDYNSAPYDLFFTGGGVVNAQFNLTSGVLVVTAPSALRPATVYHLVATFDGTTARLYVNGKQVAARVEPGSIKGYDSYGFAIGDDAGYSDPAFSGTLEGVAVYVKTLSAGDVAAHYDAAVGTGPAPPPTPAPLPSPTAADWLTYHHDSLRTGWNPHEVALTTANVNATQFGLLATLPVDGQVYAEPLVATHVAVPAIGTHDLLIVATENDSVYAYDAQSGAAIWKRSFIDAAARVTTSRVSDTGCTNVSPSIGITSTPVIDRARETIYVVAATDEGSGSRLATHLRLHAISLTNGAERANIEIGGSYSSPGGGTITFLPQWQLNRASLLETEGNVYVAFGSHCDFGRELTHGWLFGYNATTLARATNDFLTTADPSAQGAKLGSIWGGGFGPAADASGNIYAATGNGTPYDGYHSFSQSVLKLSPGLAFPTLSSFTPSTQASENSIDADLGAGGVILLPDQPGPIPRIAIAGGKTGVSFVLDRDALGGYTAGGPDRIPYEAHTNGGIFGGPAYFTGADGKPYLIVCGGNDPVTAYRLNLSSLSLSAVSQAPAPIGSSEGGTTPVVSSNGTKARTAIVWAISRPANTTTPITLYAYDGANLNHQLFAARTQPWNNPDGDAFLTPTVTGGKVYVPTATAVNIFGLK